MDNAPPAKIDESPRFCRVSSICGHLQRAMRKARKSMDENRVRGFNTRCHKQYTSATKIMLSISACFLTLHSMMMLSTTLQQRTASHSVQQTRLQHYVGGQRRTYGMVGLCAVWWMVCAKDGGCVNHVRLSRLCRSILSRPARESEERALFALEPSSYAALALQDSDAVLRLGDRNATACTLKVGGGGGSGWMLWVRTEHVLMTHHSTIT